MTFSPVDHSQSDVDPELGSLQDNGGPNGDRGARQCAWEPRAQQDPDGGGWQQLTLCPGLDQTETYRPQGPECDVGAVEDPLPRVSAVSPTTGLNTGSTPVTISGSGFTGATAVHFGTALATISVVGAETITISSPPQSPGPERRDGDDTGGHLGHQPGRRIRLRRESAPDHGELRSQLYRDGSSPDPTMTVASGSSGTDSNASISLVAPSQDTLMSCGGAYDYDAPVWTLSTSGFVSTTPLTVSETVQGEPSTAGVKVCYEALTSSTPMFLRQCASTPVAPCLESLTESMGSVTANSLRPVQRSPVLDRKRRRGPDEVLAGQGCSWFQGDHQGHQFQGRERRRHRRYSCTDRHTDQRQTEGHHPANRCRRIRFHNGRGRLEQSRVHQGLHRHPVARHSIRLGRPPSDHGGDDRQRQSRDPGWLTSARSALSTRMPDVVDGNPKVKLGLLGLRLYRQEVPHECCLGRPLSSWIR